MLPDIVYETEDGMKGIAYLEIIPYLIEAIKEQQLQIEDLKAQIIDCCPQDGKLKSAHIQDDVNANVNSARLYQNAPNPFNIETIIYYEIPSSVNNAQLYVLNMNGSLLKSIPISSRGNGFVTINGQEFSPGMYLYSLIIDGSIIDTKRMLLTQ